MASFAGFCVPGIRRTAYGARFWKLLGREREDRGKGRRKTKWDKIPEKTFPTLFSLPLPSLFPSPSLGSSMLLPSAK
jgi:hypothetical protein